jgi:hypothetical protein
MTVQAMLTTAPCHRNDGDDDSDDDDYIDGNYYGPCSSTFTTLAQLEERRDSVPAHCVEQYLLDIQIAVYEAALNKYKELLANGYDGKFQTYEKSTKAEVPDQINSFMASDKVDKYFKCQETKQITCCKDCHYATCGVGCVKGDDCKSGMGTVDMDKCPKIEFEQPMIGGVEVPRTTYTLADADGFYADIAETWGIDQSWIRFDKRLMKPQNGCQYADDVKQCQEEQNIYFRNFPVANNDKIEIYNPKKLIGDSSDKAAEMLARIKTMRQIGLYDELLLPSDLVDATSLPAFTTEQAIASMEKIVERADEIIKREREDFIISFITGLLFFIPVVGEAAGAALTSARTLLRLVGGVGDAALAVYDVVQDPENAFMAVFSALAGAGVGRAGFTKAAGARRGLTEKEYKSLGDVKTKLDKVTELRGLMSCSL